MPYRPFANQEYRNALQTWVEIPAMLRALPVAKGCRMLEIGCGRGIGLAALGALCRPERLVGLDIDPQLIELARDRLAHRGVTAELYVGDARRLPFENASFDVVVDFGTCYHIDQPDAALREVARVLAPGGQFIHESPLAQLIAHPWRTAGRALPWDDSLEEHRRAVLWGSRRKKASGG